MFIRSCLATVIGIAFLTVSAADPNKEFAATADYTTEAAKPLVPASVNIDAIEKSKPRKNDEFFVHY